MPKSCCRTNDSYLLIEGSGGSQTDVACEKSGDPEIWWQHGCGPVLQGWILERLHIVGGIALIVVLVQLIGLVCSMLLFYTIKYNQSTHTYKSYSPTIENNPRIRTYSDE